MTDRRVEHGSFTLRRTFGVTIDAVWTAWADLERKTQWFAGSEGWLPEVAKLDFRVGGEEVNSGRYGDGPLLAYVAHYAEIVPGRRFAMTYALDEGDVRTSISLATVELLGVPFGTHLTYTEQGAYFDGHDDAGARATRVTTLLDALDATLKDPGTAR